MNNKILNIIFIIPIIFLHFVIIRISDYPLTLAPFFIVGFFYIFYKKIINDLSTFVIFIIIFFYPILNIVEILDNYLYLLQFFRTYLLWIFSATVILLAFKLKIKYIYNFGPVAFTCLILIFIIVLFQYITSSLGILDFIYPFGSHSYFEDLNGEMLYTEGEKIRVPGLYLEPSFCAYITLNLISVCMMTRSKVTMSLIIGGSSLLIIQSFTGLIAFSLILFVDFIFNYKGSNNSKNFLIPILVLITFLLIIFIFYNDYIISRVSSIDDIGSSTYYRVIGLLPVLYDTLSNFIFGHALGTVKSIIPNFSIIHGTGYGSSIDNGLYLLVFYFGWFGLFFILYFIFKIINNFFNRRYSDLISLITIFFGCFFNGGIFLPEFILMTLILIYSSRVYNEK